MTAAGAPSEGRSDGSTTPRISVSSKIAGAAAMASTEITASSAFAGRRASWILRKPSR